MDPKNRRPSWWQLWLLLLVLGFLAFLEARAPLSTGGHKVIEVGIVLLVYGLVWIWLHVNQTAWLRQVPDKAARRQRKGRDA